jgi:hypothetical protein
MNSCNICGAWSGTGANLFSMVLWVPPANYHHFTIAHYPFATTSLGMQYPWWGTHFHSSALGLEASSLTQHLGGHGVRRFSLMSIVSGICDMPRVVGVDHTPILRLLLFVQIFFNFRDYTELWIINAMKMLDKNWINWDLYPDKRKWLRNENEILKPLYLYKLKGTSAKISSQDMEQF